MNFNERPSFHTLEQTLLIILVILITELFTVSNGEDNYCMSEYNSQRQPLLYAKHALQK